MRDLQLGCLDHEAAYSRMSISIVRGPSATVRFPPDVNALGFEAPQQPAPLRSSTQNRPHPRIALSALLWWGSLQSKKYLTATTVLYIVCMTHDMAHSSELPGTFENLRLELRRGWVVLAVLAGLRSEQYGYTLRKTLAERGMAIDEGTLYPLLRRLESQGLLVSEWREEDKRNKRFYRLSNDGKLILKQLLAEWRSINASLNGIL